ncbi:hypothetical protein RchiOBHm_Chr1g0318671 [Rosa chinensis]|uniref:Uncharacterized protein n=1 Tax=Rosa chinensis TaxID=74649 RepID=A0A2P6S877_ROSCH|nr:hypothetical protein RchiOBHm_Chr1g0318671 [Rosa chinensis]
MKPLPQSRHTIGESPELVKTITKPKTKKPLESLDQAQSEAGASNGG